MSLIPIDEVVHFDIATHHPSTGAVTDADSTPTFDVYEEATDTGLLGATNFTKRTSLTGNYRGTFTASAANGFEAGKWYNVIASATVNSIAGKGVAMRFRIAPAESSAGVPKVDVSHFGGSAGTFASGRPEANTTHWGGTAVASANVLIDGAITAAKIATDAITSAKVADGFLTAAKFASGAFDAVWSVAMRILTAATNITSTGAAVPITAGGLVSSDVTAISTDTVAADNLEAAADGAGYNLGGGSVVAASVTGAVGSVTGAVGSVTGNVGGNVAGSVGSVTGNVGGNVTGSVGSLATQAKADVNAEVDTALTDYDAPTNAEMEARTLVAANYATASGVSAVETDTQDIQSRLPAALVSGRMSSDAVAISGSTTAADRLELHAQGALSVVIGTGSTTTSVVLNASTGINGGAPSATNDFYNGRVLVFITGTLAGQATDISDYVGSTVTATVTALTGAPSDGDTAVMV